MLRDSRVRVMARRAAPQVPRKRRRAERPARARLERVNENGHLRWVDERGESGEGLGLTDINQREGDDE
jgi:hypothetical protein